MEPELVFQLTVRGVVNPEQWRRDRAALIVEMEALFRDRLNAREVTIKSVDNADWEGDA